MGATHRHQPRKILGFRLLRHQNHGEGGIDDKGDNDCSIHGPKSRVSSMVRRQSGWLDPTGHGYRGRGEGMGVTRRRRPEVKEDQEAHDKRERDGVGEQIEDEDNRK